MLGGMKVNRRPSMLGAALAAAWVLVVLAGASAWAEPLQRVEAKRVCMMNNSVFPKDQIPVVVGGKTYFGCCEMCKERLANDPSVREAVDPVSKKKVDKASAVIGVRADGTVLYFESEKTYRDFEQQS
jgi:YHS domain-containing protein